MTHILERWLECEQRRLNMLRRRYLVSDVAAKEVIDAHQCVENLHHAIARKRDA